MFKNFLHALQVAIEISAYQKVLRECQGHIGPMQVQQIKERIEELQTAR